MAAPIHSGNSVIDATTTAATVTKISNIASENCKRAGCPASFSASQFMALVVRWLGNVR